VHVVHGPSSSQPQLEQQEQHRGGACEAPPQPESAAPAARWGCCAGGLRYPGVIDRTGWEDQGLRAHESASLTVSRRSALRLATFTSVSRWPVCRAVQIGTLDARAGYFLIGGV